LWLVSFGIPPKIVQQMKALYTDTVSCVRVDDCGLVTVVWCALRCHGRVYYYTKSILLTYGLDLHTNYTPKYGWHDHHM